MQNFKTNQKGITLIALIITIIVMLILVGVTVSVALNGGIFGKGEKAAFQTEVSTVKEQLEMEKASRVMDNNGKPLADYSVIKVGELAGLDDKTKEKYKDKIVLDKNGKVCYNPEEVTDEEERTWLEEIGIKALDEDTPSPFDWNDVNLNIDTSADYEFEQNSTTKYVINFTNDGNVIVKLNGETIDTISARDSGNIDSSTGNLKFKFTIADVGETYVTLEMDSNDTNIQAYLDVLEQTVIYEKKTGDEPPVEEAKDSVYGPTWGAYVVLTAEGEIIAINLEGISDQYAKYEIYEGSITELANTYTQYQEYTIDEGLESKSLNKFIIGYKDVDDTTTQGVVVGALDGNDMWVIAINGKTIACTTEPFTLDSSLTLEDVLPQ